MAGAPAYANRLKEHLGKTLHVLVDAPQDWDPVTAGWYDMVWSGEGVPGAAGIDPTSGREALMNTYSGQIIPAETFAPEYRPKTAVQNHAVIYYNEQAAVGLGRVWADLYNPNVRGFAFPEGSIVVKAEAATPTPATGKFRSILSRVCCRPATGPC